MIRLTAAAALLAAAVPLPATAQPSPESLLCGASWMPSPFGEPDRWVAHVDAGPVVLSETGEAVAGRVVCTFVEGYGHLSPPVAVARSVTTPGVAQLPPTLVELQQEPQAHVSLCTSVEILGGGTYYWDAIGLAWSADPAVDCWNWFPPGPEDKVFDVVDPVLCEVLAGLSPGAGPVTIEPDGDVPGVWECPPFTDGGPS